jgi:esterase/lipase
MGLIVSMKSQDPKAIEKIGKNISVRESLFIEIVAECEQDRASAKLERLFVAKEIKSQRISDEFVGELFYTENSDHKTIVFLGGSGSGLAVNSPITAVLASHGFNVLSVPFFGEKGLPAQLSEIPLEYFERVFTCLSNNPITSGKEIYLLGMSKGAELALLLASRYPLITRVVAWAPHAYCFQGLAFKNVSSWTYAGKPLPFIRLKNRWLIANMFSCFIKNEPFGYTYTYKKGLEIAKNKEAARIKVEDIHADLLLFTSKQCNMWNTYDGSVQIMDTLRKCNYPHHYDLVVYEDAGEPYYVPYVIPAGEMTAKMAPRLVFSMGGTLEGNAHAKEDSWVKTIEFFSQTNRN